MDVRVPHLAESVTEGDIGTWLKKDGDLVRKDEPLLELETDKANLEIVAEVTGRLEVLVAAGETVRVGDVVARIDEEAGAEAATSAPAATTDTAAAPEPAAAEPAAPREATPESPAARGEKPAAAPGPAAPLTAWKDEPGTRRERMSRLRRSIAARLVEAQRTAAILTTFNEIDMSAVLRLRRENQAWFTERHGVKLGFMSLFGRACIATLEGHPELNAAIDGEDVIYHDHVHLGIAVGTDRGLVVPVVRNAEKLGLGALEIEIQRLAGSAREGQLGLDDLQGGTFTLSNGGVYGSLLSTPILNPPQTGILGMHAIQKRAVVLPDDAIAARPMMYVALSYDHRLVDGEGAVTFLVELRDRLQDPESMLLEA